MLRCFLASLAALVIIQSAREVSCHDPSAYGGLFRSRDAGATWLPANPGRIVSGAIGLAVDPTDSTHLLLATDSGLLRSRNGGLDWTLEAASVLVGAVFAVALGGDGRHALVSTGTDLFRTTDGLAWRKTPAPAGAAPARALVAAGPERLYLAGWRGLHRSDDGGATWTDITAGIPQDPVSAVAPVAASPDHVYVVAGGRLWSSTDAGVTWRARDLGIPGARLETVALEPGNPARLWAGGTGGVYRSDDRGESWEVWSRDPGQPALSIRALAVAEKGTALVLTTDRGLYRVDSAGSWTLMADTLPAHLEAWPLVRDPGERATLYAGFALVPYLELWRLAAERRTSLARIGPMGLAGGAAFLLLLALSGVVALRAIARYDRSGGPSRQAEAGSLAHSARRPRPGDTSDAE